MMAKMLDKMRLCVVLMMCVMAMSAYAQNQDDAEVLRPVAKAYTIDYGYASTLDTYLSEIRYKGYNVRLGYERMQAMKFNPESWVSQLDVNAQYANTKNPSGNHVMHTVMVGGRWGMMHRCRVMPKLQVMAGGSTQIGGGALYAPANSNNVVSVKVNWSVDATVMAIYNSKVGKLPVTLRYQAVLPVVGVMYSLDYGESYYEMYVGNHSGLVHFSSWLNRFAMTNYISVDMHFGGTSVRVGYRNLIESTYVNKLNTQIYNHSLVVGLSGEWLSVRPDTKVSEKARIISAMY